MGSTWRKAKTALGMQLCVHVPKTLDDASPSDEPERRSSEAAPSLTMSEPSDCRALIPITRTPTSSGLRISKSGSRSLKKTCAICLDSMKPGHGHALFTAECSHTFHFRCITANVKHGNQVCPVCRAKWKEIPFQGHPPSELPHGRARVNPVNWPHDDGYMTILRRFPRADSLNRQHHHLASLSLTWEPRVFDDDEPLDLQSETSKDSQHGCVTTVDIRTYPEFSAIPRSASEENFAILIHLKAPNASIWSVPGRDIQATSTVSQNSRAPVDLVTVLDVSGSMAGTKLALLKRAMGFVIQNLGPSDRLSVITFSSTARRLFHLRRMSEAGRQQALQAVNSLVSGGGTNIAEGLTRGAKVIEDRKDKNPVCSIILLSDGQDTHFASSASVAQSEQVDYGSLVPSSIRGRSGHPIPVHAFGFGADHDSVSMHSISESSGGTFSFIEVEGVIQDAFAQCIGGLLSVVVQEMRVGLHCVHSGVRLAPIKSGSYANLVVDDGQTGSIDVGDLYADEERDFLVSVNVPPGEETVLLKVDCIYRDPVLKEMVSLEGEDVRIRRPEFVETRAMSIEVDRERNRVQAAEDMAEARAAAERGSLSEAVSILEGRRRILSVSLAALSGDRLCVALDAELREMQERMASRQRYEASGRAYVLSGLSSHSWQRATARGDSTDSASLVHPYQTQSMVDMLQRSQTLSLLPPHRSNPSVKPARSFPVQPQPR